MLKIWRVTKHRYLPPYPWQWAAYKVLLVMLTSVSNDSWPGAQSCRVHLHYNTALRAGPLDSRRLFSCDLSLLFWRRFGLHPDNIGKDYQTAFIKYLLYFRVPGRVQRTSFSISNSPTWPLCRSRPPRDAWADP